MQGCSERKTAEPGTTGLAFALSGFLLAALVVCGSGRALAAGPGSAPAVGIVVADEAPTQIAKRRRYPAAERKRRLNFNRYCRTHDCRRRRPGYGPWRFRRYPAYGGIYRYRVQEEDEVYSDGAPKPWTGAWFRFCQKRHPTFDPATGNYLTASGRKRFCR